MFEGTILNLRPAEGFEPESAEADSLRPLSWSELRARLEAELASRTAVAAQDEHSVTSFDAGSARRIAAQCDGKDPVNRDDLANGKGSDCSGAASPDGRLRTDPRK